MAKFPLPPLHSVLQNIAPDIYRLNSGSIVARIFFASGNYPTNWSAFRYFGPTASRFDHHLLNANQDPYEQNRGIMYLAAGSQKIPTCLAEVFQTTRTIDRYSRNPILGGFELSKNLNLLDLRGHFSTTIGASTAINSGPRPRARLWAQRFYLAYPQIDGIIYCSSMFGNQPAIALFERGIEAIPTRPIFHRELKDPAMANVLTETAQKIRYALV